MTEHAVAIGFEEEDAHGIDALQKGLEGRGHSIEDIEDESHSSFTKYLRLGDADASAIRHSVQTEGLEAVLGRLKDGSVCQIIGSSTAAKILIPDEPPQNLLLR